MKQIRILCTAGALIVFSIIAGYMVPSCAPRDDSHRARDGLYMDRDGNTYYIERYSTRPGYSVILVDSNKILTGMFCAERGGK
jgi:hypothetical protein